MSVPRIYAESGCYHVMLRGNGKQLLFEDDGDRRAFLSILSNACSAVEIQILAWCLMDNHVHLLLLDERGFLSDAMRDIASAYAKRFNARSGHVGHVFQGRFHSMAIETDSYLLEAVRYIHNNPEKAGICAAREYPWSSFGEYLGRPGVGDTGLVLGMLGGARGFEAFCKENGSQTYRFAATRRIPDDKIHDVAASVLGGIRIVDVKSLPRRRRNDALRDLRDSGLSVRQVARATGIGDSTIKRATR